MKRHILAASLLIILSSCQKDTIPVYDTNVRYLYFAEGNSDIIRFSFKTSTDPQQATIAIPLELIGTAPIQDVSFQVETKQELTTAKALNYNIPATPLFRKGQYVDTLYVTVNNSAELASKELDVVLNIVDNAHFLAGPTKHNLCTIRLSDMVSQPHWWNTDFENNFLGKYTEEKYREFIIATGVLDLAGLDITRVQALCREFIYHLRKLKDDNKEVMEKDGTPMLETINYKG